MEITQKENKDWHRLNFSVPITCAGHGKDFIINGTAINSTITLNGVEFTGEELQKSAISLKNKPLLKDHNNSIDAIVGRVTQATFNENGQKVDFIAKVMDEKMQKMINDGRITSVSVGAMVQDLEEIETDDSSHLRAIGIDFVELSLVAVPADPNAGLAQAVMASYELKQSMNTQKEETKVTEKTETNEKILQENADLKAKLAKIEEDKRIDTLVADKVAEALKVQASEGEEAPAEESKDEEKPAEEIPVEKTEDETTGSVDNGEEEKVEESFDNYDMKRSDSGKGMSFSMKSYADTKYSNLQHRRTYGGSE